MPAFASRIHLTQYVFQFRPPKYGREYYGYVVVDRQTRVFCCSFALQPPVVIQIRLGGEEEETEEGAFETRKALRGTHCFSRGVVGRWTANEATSEQTTNYRGLGPQLALASTLYISPKTL